MANEFPKNKIELPTVGRIVYFWDYGATEPLPAVVVAVVGGHTIDLCVFGRGGLAADIAFAVPHAVDREGSGSKWDWMPYQKSQAAKTEQLQRELDIQNDPVKRTAGMLARSQP